MSPTKGRPQEDVILPTKGRLREDVILPNARLRDERAPIKVVDGRPWSPGVYQALRLLGKPLEIAWERVFIRYSHF
mgnify:CR=1 FL=1